MRIYELDDQSGKFGCRTTKFNFQTELFKQMSDNGNPFKIYYDRLQLRETRFIVPHADVQGTDMCVCVLKLLLDQWTDLLHIWWKDAPHTRITPELHFMTLGQRSRSPRGSRSP